MKKPGDPRFEQELLQALRAPMRASERNVARTRVSRRLESTLAQLEVGAASALPLLLEAPQVAAGQAAAGVAAQAKTLVAASGGVAGGAAATGATAAGVAAAAKLPLGVLLTAFALGAGAGGGTFVVLSEGRAFESKAVVGSKVAVASTSAAMRQSPRSAPPALSGPALAPPSPGSALAEADVQAEPPPPLRVPVSPQKLATGRPAPVKVGVNQASRPAESEAQSDSLTVQQALLDRARTALAHGDGAQALAALSEHARAHPTSELVEEREALTIKSLIASGDWATARARAVTFAARYPRSLFLPSIRAALPENP